MKTKKIIALMLSLALVLGVVASCAGSTSESSSEDTTASTAASAATSVAESATDASAASTEAVTASDFTERTVATDVADEGDEVVIYGWNDEFPGLVNTYAPDVAHTEVITESNSYQAKLDQVLASGEDAPDMFVCDADYASKYMSSDNTIAVNDLGIAYSEFVNEMYKYTMVWATDDNNVIKGLAWQACPCGVYYERSLAEQYLGTQDPAEVADFFADWDTFMNTARDVNEKSDGKVKVVSDYSDVFRAYLNTRSEGWITDGQLTIDPVIEDYFDMAKALYDEDLTFQTGQWTDAWTGNAANKSTLTYWGPMWLSWSLNLRDEANPTFGDWGITSGPTSFYWGGTWMMASKYCDMKASVATIMRNIAIDKTNLQDMIDTNGEFVNNISLMTAVANDTTFGLDFLGGENPYGILLDTAINIDNSTVSKDDQAINDAFNTVVASYCSGDISSVADAEAQFQSAVEDLGLL